MKQIYSQITNLGLQHLKENIKDRQICVLYRIREFYTAIKYGDEVYILVCDDLDTDIRWVTCDGVFAGEDFTARSEEEDMKGENESEDVGRGLKFGRGSEDVGRGSDDVGGGSEDAGFDDLMDVQLGGGSVSPTNVLNNPTSNSSENEQGRCNEIS